MASLPALRRVNRGERPGEIVAEARERPGRRRLGPADQHVVPAGAAMLGQHGARGGAQPPLGAVARHGVADLLRAGEADAERPAGSSSARTPAALDHQARPALPPRARGGDEIGTAGEDDERRRTGLGRRRPFVGTRHDGERQADSRLRPEARRRFRMIRPLLVAMRARKPWRRARTRLLGW